MKSIETLGGPLLVLPESAVSSWWGAYAPDGDDEVDEDETPYDWLGEQFTNYAAVVEIGGVESLVLGLGKTLTYFFEHDLRFVQCESTEARRDVDGSVRYALSRVTWSVCGMWTVREPCLMFDAVEYGPRLAADDAVPVLVPCGRYEVRTAHFVPTSPGPGSVVLTELLRA